MTIMIDYEAELEAIIYAIASGATRVSYDGKSVEYGTRLDLLARYRWLMTQLNGIPSSVATFASFDSGDD